VPAAKSLLDLELQLFFVLAGVGILDRQGRRPLNPSRLIGQLAHGEVQSTQGLRGRGKADVDADGLDRGIAREHKIAHTDRLSYPAPGRQAPNRVAVGQLIRITGT
jgi:hypothetical protein